MEFTKMHGIGNDYIYINGFENNIENYSELAIKLSNRHTSIGGDGIVVILPSNVADFKMRMFNSDGSEGKMCGNASRCIGKYVYEKGLTNKEDILLETLSGIKKLHLKIKDNKVESVAVDMGIADFNSKNIPVNTLNDKVINYPLTILDKEYKITCVSMGNPHCVIFNENLDDLDIEKVGKLFENNSLFPDRINTEFVEIISPTHLKMRVWERGSGETLACGTGACAVVACGVICGITPSDTNVKVSLKGGDLKIKFNSKDNSVIMEGGAEFCFEGRTID